MQVEWRLANLFLLAAATGWAQNWSDPASWDDGIPETGTAVNIPAALNGTRLGPIDGRDLNRCFPGSKNGSLGSRIAYDLMKEIIPQIDFGIDFHTGGAKINNYPQLRCVFKNKTNLELAKQFSPTLIVNSPFRDSTLRTEAAKNYPCIKKAWVEFLGEKPDPITERVE